ncbi:RING finger protein vilya-like [Teleopsis dalmanni]|uniref:RING finger protein vilya-like n=1 Tax=Teleopsis dalmanni TaxID=139649 RepID=UPI0018CCA09C|nr:RING finger protein vilya-like [Teleopsis dalmanni]
MTSTSDVWIDSVNNNTQRLQWIHCNRCFEIYSKKEHQFLLFACNHIACENCCPAQLVTESMPTYKCPICAKIVRGRIINNTLPQQIKILFHPEPWLKDLPTIRITEFQERHRAHFLRGMDRISQNIKELQEKLEIERSNAKSIFYELESMRNERRKTESQIRQLIKKRKSIEAAACQPKSQKPAHFSTDGSVASTLLQCGDSIRPRYLRPILSTTQQSKNVPPFVTLGMRMPNPSAANVISFAQNSEHAFHL